MSETPAEQKARFQAETEVMVLLQSAVRLIEVGSNYPEAMNVLFQALGRLTVLQAQRTEARRD
jgi:hypothetical protein